MITYPTKTCEACDEPYTPTKLNQRYCCRDCSKFGINEAMKHDKQLAMRVYRYLQCKTPTTLTKIIKQLDRKDEKSI